MTSAPDQRSRQIPTTSSPDRSAIIAIYALVTLVTLIPITVIDIPLLADYPNHLARMHVIGNLVDDSLLKESYDIQFNLQPNLAMDLLVPQVAKLVPLETAGRIFLVLTLVSTLGSVALLHRVLFNQWDLYPLLAAFLLYHGSLLAGMVNFSLGIGLVPAALALWIAMRDAPATRRLLLGSTAALVLFFCHLVAFAAYGLLVVSYELGLAWERWRARSDQRRTGIDMALAGATSLIPVLLFFMLLQGQEEAAGGSLGTGAHSLSSMSWGSWSWKAKALLAPLANYNLLLDLASFGLLVGLAFWAWWSSRLVFDRRMVPGLVLLAAVFVLAPKSLWTGGVFDQRFAILAALLFVAGTRYQGAGSRAIRIALPMALSILLLVRLSVITASWLNHRADIAEMRTAIAFLERGSRILVARPDDTAGVRLAPPRHKVFHHAPQLASLPTLAVIEKSALVSTIYALPAQQPLILKAPYRHLGGAGSVAIPTLADLNMAFDDPSSANSPPRQIARWWLDFDHVLLIYGYGRGADALKGNLPLTTRFDGDIFDLFDIRRN